MYSAIAANKRNTVLIIIFFVLLIGGLATYAGYATGYGSSAFMIIGFVALYALIQYYAAGAFAVAASGAVQITKADNPRLWRTVENIAINEGMPMPKVYLIKDEAPNAFASGRDPKHAVVAATTGLLAIMDDSELEGVMAHEMAHVKNYDIRVSTIVFGLVSAVGILADFFLRMAFYSSHSRNKDSGPMALALIAFGVVAWIVSALIGPIVSAAVSRQREYLADASAAEITRFPEGLQGALAKLRDYGQPMKRAASSMAHMYINDPVKPSVAQRLFSTHPPLDKRIERLGEIGTKF